MLIILVSTVSDSTASDRITSNSISSLRIILCIGGVGLVCISLGRLRLFYTLFFLTLLPLFRSSCIIPFHFAGWLLVYQGLWDGFSPWLSFFFGTGWCCLILYRHPRIISLAFLHWHPRIQRNVALLFFIGILGYNEMWLCFSSLASQDTTKCGSAFLHWHLRIQRNVALLSSTSIQECNIRPLLFSTSIE